MAAPIITVQPVNTIATLGQATSLSITATGSPAPTYQWYLNGTLIVGATSATYNIATLAQANCGTYYCIATNTGGSTQSNSVSLLMNVYFIDGGDHNWNTVGNWYSYPGVSTKSSTIPAVALGRLPSASTDAISFFGGSLTTMLTGGSYAGLIYYVPENFVLNIGTFTYAGNIACLMYGEMGGSIIFYGNINSTNHTNYSNAIKISNGTYYGTVSMGACFYGCLISGGTFSGAFNIYGYAGGGPYSSSQKVTRGTFNGPILIGTATYPVTIAGGTFYGTITGTAWGLDGVIFTGGNYSPAITVVITRTSNQATTNTLIWEPGFVNGGGTFTPRFTWIGLGDILGSGLL